MGIISDDKCGGVWGYLIFFSEKENDEGRNGKAVCEETCPSPSWSAPHCEARSVCKLKVMGDTCFPSHLPTSSWVAGRGRGSQPPHHHSAAQNLLCSFPASSNNNKKKRPSLRIRVRKLFPRWKKRHAWLRRRKGSQSAFKRCFNSKAQTWPLEPCNYATFVILTRQTCSLSNCRYSWLQLQQALKGPHANVGESLPPCGERTSVFKQVLEKGVIINEKCI